MHVYNICTSTHHVHKCSSCLDGAQLYSTPVRGRTIVLYQGTAPGTTGSTSLLFDSTTRLLYLYDNTEYVLYIHSIYIYVVKCKGYTVLLELFFGSTCTTIARSTSMLSFYNLEFMYIYMKIVSTASIYDTSFYVLSM